MHLEPYVVRIRGELAKTFLAKTAHLTATYVTQFIYFYCHFIFPSSHVIQGFDNPEP